MLTPLRSSSAPTAVMSARAALASPNPAAVATRWALATTPLVALVSLANVGVMLPFVPAVIAMVATTTLATVATVKAVAHIVAPVPCA